MKPSIRTGFRLEWRTAQIFQKLGFQPEQNLLLIDTISPDEVVDELLEIDVFAYAISQVTSAAFVVECKGAPPDQKLILNPTPKEINSLPTIYFDSGKILVRANENILCINEPGRYDVPRFCCTGDFFKPTVGGAFDIANKNETRNNLYKGIRQLHHALDAIFYRHQSSSFMVFPLIVTNAEIRVVNYNLTSGVTTTETVPWAAYQNPFTFSNRTRTYMSQAVWEYDARELPRNEEHQRFPAVWIVNIDWLREFVQSQSKAYPKKWFEKMRAFAEKKRHPHLENESPAS